MLTPFQTYDHWSNFFEDAEAAGGNLDAVVEGKIRHGKLKCVEGISQKCVARTLSSCITKFESKHGSLAADWQFLYPVPN